MGMKGFKKLKIATIFGTRPEIIRLVALFKQLDRYTEHIMIHTGQSYDYSLNKIFFDELGIKEPDYFLEVKSDTLGGQFGNLFEKGEKALRKANPDAVVILGDTNSALLAILARRLHIPIFHLEAGNRSFDERVPEEINRRIIDHISDINIAYSENARTNLLREGLHPSSVFVSGSPLPEILKKYEKNIEISGILKELNLSPKKYILSSIHREENVDSLESLKRILQVLSRLGNEHRVPVVMTLHPRTAKRIRDNSIKIEDNIIVHEPFGYYDYVSLQKNALCVVSDSGTIVEEAAILKIPAVQLRNSSERPEGYDKGVVILSGLNEDSILSSVAAAIDQREEERTMPLDYVDNNFSVKVVRLVLGLTRILQEKKISGFMP
jgi:UDP-N-acetylglucosamine 2-epimerase (non-hydrolysing)